MHDNTIECTMLSVLVSKETSIYCYSSNLYIVFAAGMLAYLINCISRYIFRGNLIHMLCCAHTSLTHPSCFDQHGEPGAHLELNLSLVSVLCNGLPSYNIGILRQHVGQQTTQNPTKDGAHFLLGILQFLFSHFLLLLLLLTTIMYSISGVIPQLTENVKCD